MELNVNIHLNFWRYNIVVQQDKLFLFRIKIKFPNDYQILIEIQLIILILMASKLQSHKIGS